MKRGSGKSPKSRVRSCFFQLDCEKSDFEHCQVVSSWGGRFDGQWSRSPTFVVRFSLDVSSYWRVVLLCTIHYSHTHAAGYVCLYHVNRLHQSRVNQTDFKRIKKKGKLPSHCLQKNLFGLVFKQCFLLTFRFLQVFNLSCEAPRCSGWPLAVVLVFLSFAWIVSWRPGRGGSGENGGIHIGLTRVIDLILQG